MRGPSAGVVPSRIGVCGAELSGVVPWEECLLLGVHLSGRGSGEGRPLVSIK